MKAPRIAEPGTLCVWRALVLRAVFRTASNLTPPKLLPAWPWHKPLTLLPQNSNLAQSGPGSCPHRITEGSSTPAQSQDAHHSSTVFSALCSSSSHSLVSELGVLGEASTKTLQLFASLTASLFTLSFHRARPGEAWFFPSLELYISKEQVQNTK